MAQAAIGLRGRTRLRQGFLLNAPDAATYGGDQRGYTDYPALAEA